jgi:hypothetical protein
VTLVSIDNFGEEKGAVELSDRHFDIGGDNTQWEFSGWKKANDFFVARGMDADVALFVNDSFLTSVARGYDVYWFQNAFNALTLPAAKRFAFGLIGDADPGTVILGRPIRRYLVTNFFAVPFSVAR